MMLREWKTRSEAGDKVLNRFNAERSDEYNNWLQATRMIKLNQNVPGHFETKERERSQECQDAKTIEQLRQELDRLRRCIVDLDDRMEQQLQAIRETSQASEKVRLARDYLWENRYFIWHEVEKAKKARINEGAEAT